MERENRIETRGASRGYLSSGLKAILNYRYIVMHKATDMSCPRAKLVRAQAPKAIREDPDYIPEHGPRALTLTLSLNHLFLDTRRGNYNEIGSRLVPATTKFSFS